MARDHGRGTFNAPTHLSIGADAPRTVNAVVEVPQGSSNKIEYDEKLGAFALDRVLYSPMHYPGDYGFIPSTLAADGDPLDVLVLVTHPTFPGVVISVRPIGYLQMSDEKGEDQKVLAVPTVDPRFAEHQDVSDMPAHVRAEIEHFFAIYKELEGKTVTIGAWRDRTQALALIEEAVDRFAALVRE